MAHRTNVTQVISKIKRNSPDQVVDPICGMKIDPHTSRNMVFRGDTTHYFCSKECQQNFLNPKQRKAA